MLTCPRCSKASETDPRLHCIDAAITGCPAPREVIPGKDVVLVCRQEDCGKMFAFPAASMMHRTIPTDVQCQKVPCEIMSVKPRGPKTKD